MINDESALLDILYISHDIWGALHVTYISALIYEVPYDVTQDLYIQILEEKKAIKDM